MRKSGYILICFLVLGTCCAHAENFAEVLGQVVGKDGKGIRNVSVTIEGLYSVKTDRWGFFSIDSLLKGTYMMKFEKSDYKTVKKSVEFTREWNTILVDISTGVNVEGQDENDSYEADGDIKENFQYADLPATGEDFSNMGKKTSESSSSGNDYWSAVAEPAGNEAKPFFSLNAKQTVPEIREKISIRGRVCDAHTGVPLLGVIVSMGNCNAVTDEDGRYSMTMDEELPLKRYITVSNPRYVEIREKISIKRSRVLLDFLLYPENGEE